VYHVLIFALMISIVRRPLGAECTSALCTAVAASKLPADYKAEIRQFYGPTNDSLAWIRGGTATAQARVLMEVLRDADAKGLNAEDYELRHLESDGAAFDLELTVSAMRYISDLRFGRANPGLFPAEKQSFHFADFVRQQLVDARDVKGALDGMEPPYGGGGEALSSASWPGCGWAAG
jgi:murein L,D-transpeptidase YcbB/YkuD